MKLATLRNGTRDGQLVVVDRKLERAARASGIADNLQQALDNWAEAGPRLERLYADVNAGKGETIPFDTRRVGAPLPRCYQFLDAGCYPNHMELLRKSRNAPLPPRFHEEPAMYQGLSDTYMGPHDPIVADAAWGVDFEAEVGVITDDVPIGVTAQEAAKYIRLVVFFNDVSLRELVPFELSKGFGFLQSKPSTAFSPVAVTPDEFGSAWDGGRVVLPMRTMLNGQRMGDPSAGKDMAFDFPFCIAYAAKTRALVAGSIIGAGTISNRDRARGVCCIAERRTLEVIDTGAPKTPYMSYGDRVRIELMPEDGQPLMGAIEQVFVPLSEGNLSPLR